MKDDIIIIAGIAVVLLIIWKGSKKDKDGK